MSDGIERPRKLRKDERAPRSRLTGRPADEAPPPLWWYVRSNRATSHDRVSGPWHVTRHRDRRTGCGIRIARLGLAADHVAGPGWPEGRRCAHCVARINSDDQYEEVREQNAPA